MTNLKEIITIMEIYYTKSTLKYILIKKRKEVTTQVFRNLKNDTAIASESQKLLDRSNILGQSV